MHVHNCITAVCTLPDFRSAEEPEAPDLIRSDCHAAYEYTGKREKGILYYYCRNNSLSIHPLFKLFHYIDVQTMHIRCIGTEYQTYIQTDRCETTD